MDELKEIILKMINEIEQKEKIVNIKGGKGNAAGGIYPEDTVAVSSLLGYQKEEIEKYELKPVKISKAFKKVKK